MLRRNPMLNDRAHAILVGRLELAELPGGEKTDSPETGRVEPRNYEISLIDWQCCRHSFAKDAIQEYVQQRSEYGPMNFAYLALKNTRSEIIDDSLWTQREIEASETLFSKLAAD